MPARAPILLYDGSCGFCARSVQFILTHEHDGRALRFASLQSALGVELRRRHPELDQIDSVIWLEPGDERTPDQVLVRSAAVLNVAAHLGGIWRVLGRLGALVPRFIRDAAYDFIARHRYQIMRPDTSCLLPTAEQRMRFVERDG